MKRSRSYQFAVCQAKAAEEEPHPGSHRDLTQLEREEDANCGRGKILSGLSGSEIYLWPILELVSQGKASKWKTMILDKDDNPGPGEGGSTSRDDCPTGEKRFS